MKQIALGLAVTALISTSAWADEPTTARLKLDGALAGVSFVTAAPTQAAGDPTSVSVSVGADMPSAYYFRGYRQEGDSDFTFQPWVDVGIEGASAAFNVGLWNSIHSGDLSDSDGCDCGWYETDFYAAVTIANVTATYTAYTYPNIDDSAIHELMLSTGWDNVLAPSVAIAFEFEKPEGLDKGIYLQFGVEPGVPMEDDSPLSVSFPVTVGLSLKDYYGGDDFDGNATFGYFSAGVSIGYAINDMAEVHFGVSGLAFGDYLKDYNEKDGVAIASFGFSVGF